MELTLVQIDAFAERLFEGNPAAVVPLEEWLPDAVLQAVALENNLSETAFTVPLDPSAPSPSYHLRWFTPAVEVDLCGHATLATGAYLLESVHPGAEAVRFSTRSGELVVRRAGEGRLSMDFPAKAFTRSPLDPSGGLGVPRARVVEVLAGGDDLLVVLDSAEAVRSLSPDLTALSQVPARGVIVTARGDEPGGPDVVSRFFAPRVGVAEDPVTGSAHCAIAPYWAEMLGRDRLVCRQASARGGTLWCTVAGDRVHIAGSYRRYLTGTITLP